MEIETMYEQLGISRAVYEYGEAVLRDLRPRFDAIDQTAEYNQGKVLHAMQKNRVNATHFAATTGYGYDDDGRDRLERVYASVFHSEAALVRPQITCGTHALTVALSANLLPGDEVLSPVGAPYDTLQEVIGIRPSPCSLAEYGVTYAQADLKPDGTFDYDAIREKINDRTKLITIQRSKGYSTRSSLSVEEIGEMCRLIKAANPGAAIIVDNCYGEFTQKQEPLEVGADLIAGSFIKNPGGGITPTGGYIAGRADLVEKVSHRFTAPGIGAELGCTQDSLRDTFLGFYYAPGVVCEALKTAIYAQCLLELSGVNPVPRYTADHNDIVTCFDSGSAAALQGFCTGIQQGSPIDSIAAPEPADEPGYTDKVIMASGSFTEGSTIELSCDGPLREPYTCYLQGGVNFTAARAAVLCAVQNAFFA